MANIVDIYNLDNLQINESLLTLRLTIKDDKFISLGVNGESEDLSKIFMRNANYNVSINLASTMKKYNYVCHLLAIKFEIYNLGNIKFVSENCLEESLCNGQVFIDIIHTMFRLDYYINYEDKCSGYIQITLCKVFPLQPKLPEKPKNDAHMFNELFYLLGKCNYMHQYVNARNENYILNINVSHFRIDEKYYMGSTHNICNKIIRKIELPFIERNSKADGALYIECYKPSRFYYFVIEKVIYRNEVINTIQYNKCSCSQYRAKDLIKSNSEIFNRIKKCACFLHILELKFAKAGIYDIAINYYTFCDKLFLDKSKYFDPEIYY